MMADAVLALNAGSSSLKFAVYRNVSGRIAPVSRLEIDGIGPAPHFVARNVDGVAPIEKPWPSATFAGLHDELLGWVRR
jgi:acetate kinase